LLPENFGAPAFHRQTTQQPAPRFPRSDNTEINNGLHQKTSELKKSGSQEGASSIHGLPLDHESTAGCEFIPRPIRQSLFSPQQYDRPQMVVSPQAKTSTRPTNQFNKDNVDKLVNECRKILRSINIDMITEWHKSVHGNPDEGVSRLSNIIYVIIENLIENSPVWDLFEIAVTLRKYELHTGQEKNYKTPGDNPAQDSLRYMKIIAEGINFYVREQGYKYFHNQTRDQNIPWVTYDDNNNIPLKVANRILKLHFEA